MPKNRRTVKDVCRELGSLSAKKKLAAQNLPRVKLFMGELGSLRAEKKLAAQNPPREKLLKRELGSRRHYGYENAQKQVSLKW